MTPETIPLDKNELKELLNKGWMTHDAMWFYHCLEEFGIEKTNKINQAAIRSHGGHRDQTLSKGPGIESFSSFEEMVDFFQMVMEIVSGKFMKYQLYLPGKKPDPRRVAVLLCL